MSISYDVVIIGSGAGGASSAWALTQKGLKVLVLEAGPKYNPFTDYKASQPNWEDGFPFKENSQGTYTYAEMQKLSDRYEHLRSWNHLSGKLNPSANRISYGYHHVHAVGGSSLIYTGEAHRLNPRSMKMLSKYGVGADWPIAYEDLEPYYQQAEQVLGVAGPSGDPFRPRSKPYPFAAHPISYASEYLGGGMKVLDLTWSPNSLAVLPEARKGRLNCNYCGSCQKGCPRADKGTMDVSYLRDAQDTGLCDVISGVTVTRISSNESDRITGLEYRDERGRLKKISTPALVLSAGAVESPRLLLLSKSETSPNGLANESGQVGKNFMETLLWTSSGLSNRNIGSNRGLPVDSICWDFNHPSAIPGVIGGCRFSPSTGESDLIGPINYATRVVDGWGKSHKVKMRERFGSAISVTGIAESLPHQSSYVDLDLSRKDRFGLPVAQIHSYVDDMAVRRIEFMATMCRNILKKSGVEKIFEEFSSYDIFSSTHVFGTCRMGDNPRESVVNSWGQSHRWKNLFIIDASIFPSSGGGESPSLTIQALAIRSSEYILQQYEKNKAQK